MKKRVIITFLAAWCLLAQSWGFKTKGDGTTYTFETLCKQPGSGVTVETMDGMPVFTMNENDTIAAGDLFKAKDGGMVRFMDGVTFVIEGSADFQSEERYTFADAGSEGTAQGIVMKDVSSTAFRNCIFDGVGLKFVGCKGGTLTYCTFQNNNGAVGQSALVLASDDAIFGIDYCTFQDNPKAAVASAANIYCNLSITHCDFQNNGTLNGNTPQLNLTVADAVVIDYCTIKGNPEHTMVGAIGISNFYSRTGSSITIRQCNILDNRYGIGTVGLMNIVIEDNTLKNNKYEVNPMNGGSGISLYDPYQQTSAKISGNHIEGSLWGVTVIGCKNVNLGRTDVAEDDPDYNIGGNTFEDNGNSGLLYDLYNNSTNTVYAQNNTWNVSSQTQEEIETVIFHKADNDKLGEVIYWPAAAPVGISLQHQEQDDAPVYYDLHGVRHATPQHGINIIKSGGKSKKLNIRPRNR
jgi:hypothetical protein